MLLRPCRTVGYSNVVQPVLRRFWCDAKRLVFAALLQVAGGRALLQYNTIQYINSWRRPGVDRGSFGIKFAIAARNSVPCSQAIALEVTSHSNCACVSARTSSV